MYIVFCMILDANDLVISCTARGLYLQVIHVQESIKVLSKPIIIYEHYGVIHQLTIIIILGNYISLGLAEILTETDTSRLRRDRPRLQTLK